MQMKRRCCNEGEAVRPKTHRSQRGKSNRRSNVELTNGECIQVKTEHDGLQDTHRSGASTVLASKDPISSQVIKVASFYPE